MNSHVSAILLGVKDMERSKRFYTEGLGWKVQNDWGHLRLFRPAGWFAGRLLWPRRVGGELSA